jgi:segregation and condensation protein B
LYGTSRTFLDYFSLKSLDELPPLAEIREIEDFDPQLTLGPVASAPVDDEGGESTTVEEIPVGAESANDENVDIAAEGGESETHEPTEASTEERSA